MAKTKGTKVTIKAKKKNTGKGKTKKRKEFFGLIDVPDELADRGREIWLAGLGALSTVEKEGTKAFQGLVKKGETWERSGREKLGEARKKIDDVTEQASGLDDRALAAIEDAVEGGLQRLGVPTRKEVKDLSAKVERLAEQVAALARAMGESTPAAPATDPAEDTSARAVYHVVPRDEGWAVQKEGNERATSLHASKNEALKAGREVATNQAPSRLVVHKADGTIQTSYTYDTEA